MLTFEALKKTFSNPPAGEVVAVISLTNTQSYPRKYASTSVPATHCRRLGLARSTNIKLKNTWSVFTPPNKRVVMPFS